MDWRGFYNPNLSLGFVWTLFQYRRKRHYNKGKKQNSAKKNQDCKNLRKLWFTVSIPMRYCRYTIAALSVYHSCTVGARVLPLWCKGAALF